MAHSENLEIRPKLEVKRRSDEPKVFFTVFDRVRVADERV
jgi:hypothetical protein